MAAKENTNEHENGDSEAQDHENGHQRSKAYEQARSQFGDLGAEEKAAFLVESIITTVTEGLKEVSDQVSDAFKQACEKAEEEARKYREAAADEDDAHGAEGKASDEPTADAKKTGAKKKASAKKKSTGKKKPKDSDNA